ncbi:MAG TPA: PIN domain-containing protein [Gemmatimonadaceae bacterium]
MSVGLDTSVVLRLLTGTPPHQAETARGLLASAQEPVTLSDLVVGETYFALRHHYAVPHADAVRPLTALLSDPRVRGSGVARAVLAEASSRGPAKSRPGLIDRLIHADYGRDDLQLVTFDRDLARIPGVRLLPPDS